MAQIQLHSEGWLCLLPVAAYLYGSVPFGFLAARLIRGVDIRQTGSGNIGATNAARVLGFKFFPPIFLLDMSKGFLPVLAAVLLASEGPFEPPALAVGAGLGAILGHVFPIYLGFKGGKAVATGTGAFLVLAPRAVLAAAVVWAAVFAVWRYVSLASILAAVALPASLLILHEDALGSGRYAAGFAVVAALLVIWRHRGNIARLLKGAESKIGARREPGPEPEGGGDDQGG